ncbi:G-type lectin S-receptor-like serine/threonine-protein kinase At1g11300 [Panicum virgatum]|uniref:G-type lectin S-receptor-like serine/threonine-protein kinase At1g11300 n=1 Tax=Panicum virgatum TaxID=38727 RepID=UPI0019D69861|nr:G-type lectin S-receptor-like serine/threonine-protein kinase At1g11300 [Panicum virgatum]
MSSMSVCTVAFLLLPALCASDDRLVPGKPLLPGTTVISDGGDFALGFFSPSNSTPEKLYLGIWYNNIPQFTVVWVANRETPAMSSSAPSLVITNNTSDLVLSDANGRVLWTTNTTTSASSSPSPRSNTTGSVAVLTNTGNLILRSPGGMVLWQSFDHPTDTLLPGMKIWRSHKTDEGNRLVSWKGPDDPSPGAFSFGWETDQFIQAFIRNGSLPEWRGLVWTGFTVSSQYDANTSIVVYVAYEDTVDEMSAIITVSDGAPHLRSVMSYSGRVEGHVWKRDSSEWAMLGVYPDYECSRYGYCGPSGYCDHTDANSPTCKCFDGFEPVDKEEWNNGRFSQGCRRKEAFQCGDGFLALPDMKVPDKFERIGRKTFQECAAECSANRSCVAYAYATLNGSTAKGDGTRCLVWIGDHRLVDAQKLGVRPYNTAGADSQETLYLRVAGMPSGNAGKRTKNNKLKVMILILAVFIVLSSILLVWVRKFRGRKTNTGNQKKLMHGGFPTLDELGREKNTNDFELPFLKFQDILVMTNNFSSTFMIGQGGFGKVYKGTLEGGREVAIKRLSRDSDQGNQEFRNEVILIAKLQHRNLVRLLGCCIEGDEKLLIYEYLPNKSLDAIIFNHERNATLDWPIRFGIIKGVARGLLYLHHDSRLTIVHRDLKASNILLDAEMRPKIADFGMARIFGDNQENANTRRVVGTYGYMAPEYAMEGIFSAKTDVYSFGVLLLEVVSGIKISSVDRIPSYANLIVYAWNLWKEGKAKDLVDKCIVENCLLDEASLCVHMGLLCVQENPDDRPFMSSVVLNLENGCTTLPAPNHPAYFVKRNSDEGQMSESIVNSKNTVTLTVIEGR